MLTRKHSNWQQNLNFNAHSLTLEIRNGFMASLLARCGDVQPNPGLNKVLLIILYNVRGASDKAKTKRIKMALWPRL